MDLNLRLVRAFLVAAEELHFTRAAARLFVTPQALTQQIRRLEADLGLALFRRTTRRVELTDAGREFLPAARELDRAAHRTATVARLTRRATENLIRVGYLPGSNNLIPAVTTALRERRPELTVQSRRLDWSDQTTAVHEGRVDAALVRPPLDFTGLKTRALATEHRVVVLPTDHPLAGRESVDLSEIADEPIVKSTSAPREWGRWWTVDPRPDGRRPVYGPDVHTVDDMLEAVAHRQAIAITAASLQRYYRRHDITYVELTGVEPTTVVLCWNATDRRRLLQHLILALDHVMAMDHGP